MKVEILPDADTVARTAAQLIAAEARAAVAARGHFALAVSGGHTPWQMLRLLATEEVPWKAVHLFQVDERIAPTGDPDRNLTHIQESLLSRASVDEIQVHAMPVEEKDLTAAMGRYARELESIAGSPAVLDLVHLGLGPDGHTASLVPGDPSLEVTNVDVTLSGPYQGHLRMTLTYPVLNRARRIIWVITGAEKVSMFARLQAGDRSIPAGRVRSENAVVLADSAAAGVVPQGR
jgi:6-phosphogluconolactonase